MEDLKRTEIAKGVNFNYIKSDIFKTNRISITMFLPLKKENAAAYALLPPLLTRSCEKYPDFTKLNNRLDTLYGACLYSRVRKFGESLALTVSISGIDDRFALDDTRVSLELCKLLYEVIFHPKFAQGSFDENDLVSEKRQLIENIEADLNDKLMYSIDKTVENMCQSESFGVKYYGSLENVREVTFSDILKAWKTALKSAKIEIIMIGNTDESDALTYFKNAFSKICRSPYVCATTVVNKVDKIKEIEEKADVTQARLVMGFRTGVCDRDKESFAMRLAIAILGGGVCSKFFLNIREKQGLCYFCGARYEPEKALMLAYSGVENENVLKTKTAILENLEALKNGDISDYEFDGTKKNMINNYNMLGSTTSDIESWYILQTQGINIYTPKMFANKLASVTKQEVIDAAKKIKLDTVFVLRGK